MALADTDTTAAERLCLSVADMALPARARELVIWRALVRAQDI
ncbi:hypothetical protein [Thiosulfatihalobacter marinus]|nr:hypothetical protein [Thiosulfatihalobacter marinus]